MPSLTNDMMRAIIMDHASNPAFKHTPEGEGYEKVHMKSDNCIDDIDIYLKVDGDKVVDASFEGRACAISTASTDIMCSMMIGKTKEEGLNLIEQYMHMIHEEDYDSEILEEALAFQNTSKQAARIRCATIGWSAAKEILDKNE
ncbi:MAG: SUF system NifU family Fe-S cluster assembly protein [Coprobacillus sp.]|nr:SUF system NifU family Fe-S cluster assembly protein [Coprobacillus sp.]